MRRHELTDEQWLPILWAGSLLMFIFGAKALGFASESPTATAETSHWATEILPFAVLATLILAVVVATLVFCRLAIKTAVSRRWLLACCLVLAIVGAPRIPALHSRLRGPRARWRLASA